MLRLAGDVRGLAAGVEHIQSLFSFENNGKLTAVYDPLEGDSF